MKKKSLYVHIPFCKSKCLFCSFVVNVSQEHRIDHYLDAVDYEMSKHHQQFLETIYIGGGTPTMLNSNQLLRLFAIIKSHFDCDQCVEITVEANPEGLTHDHCIALKKAGVNRLSIGVQSMNDKYLTFLGRCHDSQTAQDAIARVQSYGFDNVSIDLMYSFPGQSAEEIIQDVERIVSLKPQHISLYSLTIEQYSRFYAQELTLDDPEKLAEDYALVIQLLDDLGYEQYEVSNFSKPGFQSKHNQRYWQGGEYIGVGIGAHGYENGERYWNTSTLADYLKIIEKETSPRSGHEKISPEACLYERLVFGLRMNMGVFLDKLEQETGCKLTANQKKTIDFCIDDGLLELRAGRLCSTQKGLFVLDDIAVKLCR